MGERAAVADASRISERDKAEACSVTTTGSGHQFEIQLGHLCNNRCVFCSSGQLTQLKLARPIALDPIVQAIEQARAAGARRITFLGGEPTLHKGFEQALGRAVALGFEEIVIFTNGVMLPHPGFVDRICALGRFEWRISIQGGNEAAHVAVTKRPDSFRRIAQGLELLRARGQDVTANVCVNEESYRSLPDYPELVARYGIRQLHVDIVRPSSTGDRDEAYLRAIMPRYSTMAPYFAEMLARFEAWDPDFDVNVGNLPYCVLPEWSHRIHHGGEATVTQSADESSLEIAVDKYDWHASLRRHVPACEGCALRPQCTGIFSKYLELYGDAEFRAVSQERLDAAAPRKRYLARRARQEREARQAAERERLLARAARLGAVLLRQRTFGRYLARGVSVRADGSGVDVTLSRADGGGLTVRFDVRPDARLDARSEEEPAAAQGAGALRLDTDFVFDDAADAARDEAAVLSIIETLRRVTARARGPDPRAREAGAHGSGDTGRARAGAGADGGGAEGDERPIHGAARSALGA